MAEHRAGLRVGPHDESDKYSFGRVVGHGGQGAVHQGTLAVHGRDVDVAIKVITLPADPAARAAAVSTLQEECELVRSIAPHPSIVRVRETFVGARPHYLGAAGNETYAAYLVMDWVAGTSLVNWVIDNPHRTYGQVLSIITGLCSGVAHLHAGEGTNQPVFHRDIKPANIIVGRDLDVTLVDFGIASGQAIAPLPAGTLGYWAPELRRYADTHGFPTVATCESDLFSIAGVTYWAFTGFSPPEDIDRDALRAALEASPVLATQPKVVDQVLGGLDVDPSRRSRWCPVTRWASELTTNATSSSLMGTPPPVPAAPTVAPLPLPSAATAPAAAPRPRGASAQLPARTSGAPAGRRRSIVPWLVAATVVALLATLVAVRLADDDGGDDDTATGSETSSTTTTTEDPTTTEDSTTTTERPTSTTERRTTTTTTTTTPVTTTTVPVKLYLDDLETVSNDYPDSWGYFEPEAVTMSRVTYQRSRVLYPTWCYQEHIVNWNVPDEHDMLTGVVGVSDGSSSSSAFTIRILLDDATAWVGSVSLGNPERIDLPVGNALRLRIEVTGDPCSGDSWIGLGDMAFE